MADPDWLLDGVVQEDREVRATLRRAESLTGPGSAPRSELLQP
jgi:hypothetical protein